MTSSHAFPARLFIAATVAAPIPLGSARPLAWSLLAAVMAAALLAWAWRAMRQGGQPAFPLRRMAVPGALYGAALAWGVAQVVPMMPDAWGHPAWFQAEAVLGPLPRTISMTPLAGLHSLLRLATYGAAFFLAVQMGGSRHTARWMVECLALGAVALALYGLLEYASGTETILWIDKWDYRGTLTATLVNRNHYATLAGLGLLCTLVALALRIERLPRGLNARSVLTGGGMLWTLLAGLPVLMLALALTESRAGLAATFLAVVVLALSRKRLGWAVGLGIPLLGIVLAVALWGRLPLLGEDAAVRLRVYSTSLSLIEQRPWLGSGLGSFADAFAAVRPVGLTQLWEHAHCDWLEMVLELGAPAAGALFASLAWLVGRCVVGLSVRRRDRMLPALGVAAATLVGSHALVDFSLQIPAVAVTFATILGIAVAQSWSSRDQAIGAETAARAMSTVTETTHQTG